MSGQQQFVAAGGAALLALNFWTGDGRKALNNGIFAGSSTPAQQQTAHKFLVKTGASVLFVVAATLAAGMSVQVGNAMAAVIVALFILWMINHYSTAK